MAGSHDDLIEQLLCDIALSGSLGLSVEDLKLKVKAFYDAHPPQEPRGVEGELGLSDAPSIPTINVDEHLMTALWDELSKHPDAEVRTFDAAGPRRTHTDRLSTRSTAAQTEATSPTPESVSFRMVSTEERMWSAIAGHCVDHKKIPFLEFQCLSGIASRGITGIFQPDLTKLVGQQKQSVPRRTDVLAQKGYITKKSVTALGMKTSLLKLKRFDQDDEAPAAEQDGASGSFIEYNPAVEQPLMATSSGPPISEVNPAVEQPMIATTSGPPVPAPPQTPTSQAKTSPRAKKVDSRPALAPKGNKSASKVDELDTLTFSRQYVNAHLGEKFHHVGNGRYRRGPKPLKNGLQPPTSQFESSNRMILPPGQSFHAPSGTFATNSVWPPPEQTLKVQRAIASGKPPSFSKEYVYAHPEEEFHYIGFGHWRGGPKPVKPMVAKPVVVKPTAAKSLVVKLSLPRAVLSQVSVSDALPQAGHGTYPQSENLVTNIGRAPEQTLAVQFTTDPAVHAPPSESSVWEPEQGQDTQLTAITAPESPPFEPIVRRKRKYESRKRKAPAEVSGRDTYDADDAHQAKRPHLNDTELENLIIALGLIRTLCAGIGQVNHNWDLTAHALGFKYDAQLLRSRWSHYAKSRSRDFQQAQDIIRDNFLAAYEQGDLPRLDFGNLSDTDWPGLFAWAKHTYKNAERRTDSETDAVSLGLPRSRAELEARFTVAEPREPFDPNEGAYFSGKPVLRDRFAMHYIEGDMLAGEVRPGSQSSDDLSLLKSWCRAVALTKESHYNATAAGRKIGVFSNALIQRATMALVNTGVLAKDKKDRQLPGRNYYLSKSAQRTFERWPEKIFLHHVASTRARLLSHFEFEETYELSYHGTRDSEIVVLMNMVAQGLLTIQALLPERNDDFAVPFPKLSAWGVGDPDDFYNAQRYDQARIRFPIQYSRTPTFTAQHGLTAGVPIPMIPPLVDSEPGLRLPCWVDIHGNCMTDYWGMALRSVLHLVVYRTGTTALAMERAHEGKLWLWEVQMVLQWMETVGLAMRFGPGSEVDGAWDGGWRAGEWWYCAFASDMVVGWEV